MNDLSIGYQMTLLGIGITIGAVLFRDFSKDHLMSIVCMLTLMFFITIVGSLMLFGLVNLMT